MLRALYDYALQENLILPAGFVKKNIRAYVSLSKDGAFLGVVPGNDKKVSCPDIGSMANSTDKCNVLAEKRCILFPGDEEQKKKYAAKVAYFRSSMADAAKQEPRLELCLKALDDEETAAAVSAELDRMKLDGTKVVSFLVDGQSVLEMPAVQNWWKQFRQQFRPGGKKSLCLITGRLTVPMATVPPVSGLSVVGGHSKGDALICFDKDAFCSYNLKQSANAPVSEEAFAGVKAALDHLLETAPVLAGMKFVHWYDRSIDAADDVIEEAFTATVADEDDEEEEPSAPNPHQAREQADALVNSVITGEAPHDLPNLYYILLLSGVNGRVMVRVYQRGNYEQLTENLKLWQQDLEIVNSAGTGSMKPVKFSARLIRLMPWQESNRKIFERMSEELSGLTPALLQAVMEGRQLPNSVLSRAIGYIRSQMFHSEEDRLGRKVPDPWACQWLKVWLCRKERERDQKEELSVEYNEKHPEPAYHCGALVAVYGMIQSYAMPDVNSSLIDRYFSSASQAPALVLGQLARMSNYHLSKLEKLRGYFSNLRDQVACAIGQEIPTVLAPEQQAYFAIGYYQMCAKLEKDRRERKAAEAAKTAKGKTGTDETEEEKNDDSKQI